MKPEEAVKVISFMIDNDYKPVIIWGADKEQIRGVVDRVIDNTKISYFGFDASKLMDDNMAEQVVEALNSVENARWLVHIDDITNGTHIARSRAYKMLCNGRIEDIFENTVLKNDHIVIGGIINNNENVNNRNNLMDRTAYRKLTHIVLDEASI